MSTRWKMLVLFAFLACTACADDNHAQPHAQSYDNDGMLGATNTNPSLGTSPTYHTYADDIGMMKAALRQVPGVATSSIVINGPNAYVGITLLQPATRDEQTRIVMDAEQTLNRMMPRYNVKVVINNK